MIIPELEYRRRIDDFMVVLQFKSFKDLTQFFYERPKFLEQLRKFNSYCEPQLRGNKEGGSQTECWLYINNNDLGGPFKDSLGITKPDLRNGRKIRNKKSGKIGTIYDNILPMADSMTHIKVQTDTGKAKWLLTNVEAVK